MNLEDMLKKAQAGDTEVLGMVPSPLTPKIYTVSPQVGATPDTFTLKAFNKVPVLYQEGSTCVGNSIATALMYEHFERTGEILPFKGEIFNEQITHQQYAATFPTGVYDEILAHGAISEDGKRLDFPQSYAAVDSTNIDTIKNLVSSGHALTTATWLNKGFWNQSNNHTPDYVAASPGEADMSYHAMCVVGYTALGCILQNSWSMNYNVKGFNYLSWDYMKVHTGELWVLNDDSSALIRTYNPPPEGNRAVKKGKGPAVYLVKSNGRIWIQNPAEAYRMGVNLAKVESLDPKDEVWLLPVIGQDAPLTSQG